MLRRGSLVHMHLETLPFDPGAKNPRRERRREMVGAILSPMWILHMSREERVQENEPHCLLVGQEEEANDPQGSVVVLYPEVIAYIVKTTVQYPSFLWTIA
jgi:hypothetical protein